MLREESSLVGPTMPRGTKRAQRQLHAAELYTVLEPGGRAVSAGIGGGSAMGEGWQHGGEIICSIDLGGEIRPQ